MRKGRLYLFLSAFLYGVMPILAAVAYRGGINGITLSFLRSAVSVPILFLILKADRKSLRLTNKQKKDIIKLSVIGGAMPILLLYLSYLYIPISIATTMHFTYPLIVVLAAAAIQRTKIERTTLSAVIFVTIGIYMCGDISMKSNKLGILLALLSGILYSFYIIYLDSSGLCRMNYGVLTFYTMLVMSISIMFFALATNTLSFKFNSLSFSFSALISLLATLGAMPLFQAGIRYVGAETAGIISAVEPITTTVLSVIILGEGISVNQSFGTTLILLGVLICQKGLKTAVNH